MRDRCHERPKEFQIDALRAEGRAPYNDLVRAIIHGSARAIRNPNAPAHATRFLPAERPQNIGLPVAPHGRVEVNHLNFREVAKLFENRKRIRQFQFLIQRVALDKLDNFAAHQVDAGNHHS